MFKIETRYALHAAVILAQNSGRVSNKFLSKTMELSLPMIAKIMNMLGQNGIVDSKPGPGGGYQLARNASGIKLYDVVSINEGDSWGGNCILGKQECTDDLGCVTSCSWPLLREHVVESLHTYSIQQMADGVVDLSVKIQGK